MKIKNIAVLVVCFSVCSAFAGSYMMIFREPTGVETKVTTNPIDIDSAVQAAREYFTRWGVFTENRFDNSKKEVRPVSVNTGKYGSVIFGYIVRVLDPKYRDYNGCSSVWFNYGLRPPAGEAIYLAYTEGNIYSIEFAEEETAWPTLIPDGISTNLVKYPTGYNGTSNVKVMGNGSYTSTNSMVKVVDRCEKKQTKLMPFLD